LRSAENVLNFVHKEADFLSNESNSVDELIGARIRRIRESKKLSQKELAFKMGIPLNMLEAIESGQQRASSGTIRDIAAALDVTVRHFFELSEPGTDFQDPESRDEELKKLRSDICNAVEKVDNQAMLHAFLIVIKAILANSRKPN
jgi:transcriptional regulator with XRE-family HTH domain